MREGYVAIVGWVTSPRLLAVAQVEHAGGAEIVLTRLLGSLAHRGWTVDLATPGPGSVRDHAAAAGWGTPELRVGGLEAGAGMRALASWPRARRLAREADVVYLNGGVAGRLLPAVGNARTVLHVHDMVERVPRFWRRADVVLAVSDAGASALTGLDAHVVPVAVDPDPPPVAAPWTRNGGPVIGFVGRIEPRKAPLDFIRAAPAIRAGCPEAKIVVVGEDPFASDPAYTAQVDAAEGIERYPWIDGAAGLMRHLDVLVMPSLREPGATAAVEAMVAGVPVVATHVDGLPEVVSDGVTGRLVAPRDPAAIAAAVLEVLDRRDELGAAGRVHARRFHTEHITDTVEALLR
jgi:glycosyltransferase involved in cell wall biosynthesis